MTTTTKTRRSRTQNGRTEQLGERLSNDGAQAIGATEPYIAHAKLRGVCSILLHRWSDEDVEAKANAKKGSAAKKTDNVEAYVYRNEEGEICIPGRYLYGSIASKKEGAAKYRQDPRSARKSALDLYKAGIVVTTELASLGTGDWDYLDKQRVVVNHSGVSRVRPAFLAGWEAEFDLLVSLPEYIPQSDLLDVLVLAGKLVGLADFRPTYGRFEVTSFEVGTG